jgi:hypothetical protein
MILVRLCTVPSPDNFRIVNVLCTNDSLLQSYLESRDQEAGDLKPAQGKLVCLSKPYARNYVKNPEHKGGLLEWLP